MLSRENQSSFSRVAIVGPTASGKTAVALHLAQRLATEIVSADSMQVYRHMNIGTAKPTPEEQAQAVFHAIDVADPDQEWTLADFQACAEQAISAMAARGRKPVIVGGTGLYIRALTTQLNIPNVPPDAAARDQWRKLAQEQGNLALQQELARVDFDAAARIHVNDVNRLVRALEVYTATGVPLSEWHRRNREQRAPTDVLLFGLNFSDRSALYARIEARVEAMVADGFLEEVHNLLACGYGRELKPMRSLGYRHLAAVVSGETDLKSAMEGIKQETRQFAKRQLIWFRSDPRIYWLDAELKSSEMLADEIWVQIKDSKQ